LEISGIATDWMVGDGDGFTVNTLLLVTPLNEAVTIPLVTEKGFITFAAGESRKSRAQPDRRESDETVQ
jgi:hypothetical protein